MGTEQIPLASVPCCANGIFGLAWPASEKTACSSLTLLDAIITTGKTLSPRIKTSVKPLLHVWADLSGADKFTNGLSVSYSH